MKKILAIALASAMVLSMGTAAMAEEATSDDFQWNGQKEVWAILPTTGVPGLLVHADSMGYVMGKEGWNYVTKDAMGDPSNQVSYVEDAIAAGNVGALMIAAMDCPMLEDVAQQAKEAGIAVTYLGAAPEYEITGYIATKYSITGIAAIRSAEDWVQKRVAEGGNIQANEDGTYDIALDVYYDIQDGIYRSNALIGTANDSALLNLVSTTQSYGTSAQTDAYDNAQAVLAANPNCRIFIAYEPDSAMGIAAALADYADQNGLDLADFCVMPCYSADDTFLQMWEEAKADPSANAIKGFATFGGVATEEQNEEFKAANATATGMGFSATGGKLAEILLGATDSENYTWEYGKPYFDDITATNIYGFDFIWKQGDENIGEKYEVNEAMY
ncbi:MAG: substrate-binding domain-containing protein [Parasporobacterium sp.]|nr:substrate-binding domain-containing protein [Parasporobacterium sp.]